MAYLIQAKGASTTAENAAVVTAFNNLITALHAACGHKVDAAGTFIGATRYTADETSPHGVKQGDQW
jgi:hypothetical protein